MSCIKRLALGVMIGVTVMCQAASAGVIGTTDSQVKAIAAPMLDDVLDGLKNNNYGQYAKDFDATLREVISKSEFIKVRGQIEETMGFCESKEYIGFLVKGDMTMALWKARFSKSADDILIKLIVTKRGDKYLVAGLWFQ